MACKSHNKSLMCLEMVLVYCCFLSFKIRDNLTVQLTKDLSLWGERKLFQAYVPHQIFC